MLAKILLTSSLLCIALALDTALEALSQRSPALFARKFDHQGEYSRPQGSLFIRQSGCPSGYGTCGTGCAPLTATCCDSLGDYCNQGNYCDTGKISCLHRPCWPVTDFMIGGCCPNGKRCSGLAAGCDDGDVPCGSKCMPEGKVCCLGGSYCDAGETCTSSNTCIAGGSGSSGSSGSGGSGGVGGGDLDSTTSTTTTQRLTALPTTTAGGLGSGDTESDFDTTTTTRRSTTTSARLTATTSTNDLFGSTASFPTGATAVAGGGGRVSSATDIQPKGIWDRLMIVMGLALFMM